MKIDYIQEIKMLKLSRFLIGFFLLLIVFASVPAMAQQKPIQVSLFTPIQIFPESDAITGLRLNFIYGRNTTVVGVDWGLVNHTTSGLSKGWQAGVVSIVDSDFIGFQHSGLNLVKGNFEGLQLGIVNHANYASGVQFGLVNYARSMKGLQIGLVNIIGQGGQFPVFPIVNWSF